MKNKILGGLAVCTLLAAAAVAAPAQKSPAKRPELTEKTGVIQIQKADKAKKEKYDTVLLKVGEETIKLIPGRDKKAFKPLEKLDGKTVKVTGEWLSPKPPKYPLAAMKVESFTEVKEPAETKK